MVPVHMGGVRAPIESRCQMMKYLLTLMCATVLLSTPAEASTIRNGVGQFFATAYAQRGITRSGVQVAPGHVAADPSVLPLGTTIQVRNAGPYSGTYTVADTGSKVKGRHIDIFIGNRRRALEFGRRVVEVTVLKWGNGYLTNIKSPKRSG